MKTKIIFLVLFLSFSSFSMAQEVVIRDSVTTGYKANVNKLGTKYGLGVDSTPASTVYEGQVTVTTSGTRVQLSGSSVPIRSVCIKAMTANTGNMYLGDITVSSSNGYEMPSDTSVCIDINNLNLIYVDSSVNGEKVSYLGIN